MLRITLLTSVVLAFASFSSFAETNTVLSFKKITTLSGTDATGFKKVYGETTISSPDFSIQFDNHNCTITATRAGFSGKLATQLLNGRKEAMFVSENGKFKLQCGVHGVAFCNVTQNGAILD